jgi:hypothetical protein
MGAGTTMTMDAGDWRHAIDQVMISIADDGNKYGLAGIKVDEIGPVARLVTTDGNRLTYSEVPYTGKVWAGNRTILPRRAMAEFRKLLDGVTGPVPATVAERSAVFILPGATLHARMLESEFPDYRQVLPSRFKRKITVNRDQKRRSVGVAEASRMLQAFGGVLYAVAAVAHEMFTEGSDMSHTGQMSRMDVGDMSLLEYEKRVDWKTYLAVYELLEEIFESDTLPDIILLDAPLILGRRNFAQVLDEAEELKLDLPLKKEIMRGRFKFFNLGF